MGIVCIDGGGNRMDRKTQEAARLRVQTAKTVHGVWANGQSLDDALIRCERRDQNTADRALYRNLSYGTLRWFHRLDKQLNWLLERPLRKRDGEVHAALLVGLYQIEYTRIPDHAAVAETVNAVRLMGRPGLAGLANAVLRRFLREKDVLNQRADGHADSRFSHPDWFIEQLKID